MPHAFREAVERRDLDGLIATLAPDVVLHSPVTHRPFEGREAAGTVLGAVMQVFEDFRYVAEVPGDDMHVLMFEARVGDRLLQGVDLLRSRPDGLVEDLTVMVRPLSGVLALRDAMAQKLAAG